MRLLSLVLPAVLLAAGCQSGPTRGLPSTSGDPPAAVDVPAFHVLGPGVAGSGQPAPEGFPALREHGYSTVINLRTDQEDRPENEAAAARSAKLAYYELPVAANTIGTYNAYRLGEILRVAPQGSVLIHCSDGERVGALWGVYVGVEEHLPAEQAVAIARAAGMSSAELAARVDSAIRYQAPPPE